MTGQICNDCGHAEDHPLHTHDHPFERVRRMEGDATAEVNHLRGLLRAATTPTEGADHV